MKPTDNTVPIASGRFLKLSEGPTRNSKRVKNTTVKFAEFVQRLKQPVRTPESLADFFRASKKVKNDIKDQGYYIFGHFDQGIRKKINLQGRDAIVLDGDFLSEDYELVLELALSQVAHVYCSTHSHRPKKPRIRVVIPLTRSVTPDEYVAIARKIANDIGMDYFDDTTYEVSRPMFWPSVSKDGDYVFYEQKGDWLNPDDVLARYTNWQDQLEWPLSSRELDHPEKALRQSQKSAQDPLQKPNIIGSFCRTYTITDVITKWLPDIYEPGIGDNRYSYLPGSTINGAVVYDDKFLYSNHGTDPVGGRLVNAFDLVRLHLYREQDDQARAGTPAIRMPSYMAMSELARNDTEVKEQRVLSVIKDFNGINSDEDTPAETGKTKASTEWLKELALDDRGNILPKLTNIELILQHDTKFAGRIAFNELAQSPVFTQSLPWMPCVKNRSGTKWDGHDDLQLRQYLETVYKVEVSKDRVFDVVNLIALKHRFHPIKDYLGSLHWDGEKRIDTMLHRYLGVARSAYSDAVSRKVLCAAVARVFTPGCKFDYVLVLESRQGQRKSSFIETLAVDWFGDGVESFKGKEAVEGMLGQWIIELGELTAFSRADIESMKAFITRKEDRVRLAYDRRPGVYPRQTIFIGTTNRDDYLKDETGNRRFWPVACEVESIDVDALKQERDQLWAEAVQLWQSGEPLYLENQNTEQLASAEQKERYASDSWSDLIAQWLDQPIPENYWELPADVDIELMDQEKTVIRDRTCIREIWENCFKRDITRMTATDENRIRRCMLRIDGWSDKTKATRFGQRYGNIKGYQKIN